MLKRPLTVSFIIFLIYIVSTITAVTLMLFVKPQGYFMYAIPLVYIILIGFLGIKYRKYWDGALQNITQRKYEQRFDETKKALDELDIDNNYKLGDGHIY